MDTSRKIEFPNYVPEPVKKAINGMIYGDEIEPLGLFDALLSAKDTLKNIRSNNKDPIKEQEALNHYKYIEDSIECLKRLGCDIRMKEAFDILSKEFLKDDARWRDFIYSAWATDMNYKAYRDNIKIAHDIKNDITKTANKLASLIEKIGEIGILCPYEYFSITSLLEKTDNTENRGHNLQMWQMMRKHILGDVTNSTSDKSMHDFLKYAWKSAPSLVNLLRTLERVSQDFNPQGQDEIEVALSSRQHNAKTEYLRAFIDYLGSCYNFKLTANIKNAIARTAEVVINDSESIISRDCVSKVAKSI